MKYLKFLLITVAIVLPVLLCCGCGMERVNIDWTMYGVWIGEDGQVEDTFEFRMVGKSVADPDDSKSGRLELSIQWPEDFRFRTEDANEHTLGYTMKREDSYFLTGNLLSDDLQTNRLILGDFLLAPGKEYFLIYWTAPDGSYEIPGYLIASTDPNTSREEIEEFFSTAMSNERFQ